MFIYIQILDYCCNSKYYDDKGNKIKLGKINPRPN